MPERMQEAVYTFQGGFATDLAPQVRQLTFLELAENLVYEVSGAVRKVGGAERLNSTAITSAPAVIGMYDFWSWPSSGTPTQKFIAVTDNGKVYKEDMDTVFDDITGAAVIGANAIPSFTTGGNKLVIFFSDNSTPLEWNGIAASVSSLSGSPPLARVCCYHNDRLWAAGTNATPSRLAFTQAFSASATLAWTGGAGDTAAGTIDVDPEDGDRIVGLKSHKGRLLVFKGPNIGSIQQIKGTGASTYSREPISRGIPLQAHNSIVEIGDDVWFMSPYGLHSIAATEKYGDFANSFLTRFLQGYFRDSVRLDLQDTTWGCNYAAKGLALWTVTGQGSTTNNLAFGLSYIRKEEEGLKAFVWKRTCRSAAIRIHPTSKLRELMFGDGAGFVQRQDIATRILPASTAYTFRVKTPFLVVGAQNAQGQPKGDLPVTLHRLWARMRNVGNYNLSISLQRDEQPAESYTLNMGSAGFVLGTSTLGSALGAGDLMLGSVDLSGEARAIQLDLTQGGASQDANLYELGILYTPAAASSATTL